MLAELNAVTREIIGSLDRIDGHIKEMVGFSQKVRELQGQP